MENKIKYISIAVIVLVLLIAAGFVYQQKMIMNLKQELIGKNVAGPDGGQIAAINNPFTVKAVQKNLEDNIKEIRGTIISKNGSLLTIEAEIVDFSKLAGLTEDELHQSAASFPKTKKNYEVLINDKTQLASLGLEALSVGTTVTVESDEPVYKSDRINVSKITVIVGQDEAPPAGTSLEDQIKQSKFIGGIIIIKEIGDKYLVVGTSQIDFSQVKDPKEIEAGTAPIRAKDYKVFLDDKTQFTDKRLNEFEVGQFVRAFSSAPVYSVSEFTATKIQGPLQF